jgi:AraC-like DNA-binding protein
MNAVPAVSAWLPPQCLHQHRLFESRDLDDTRERISGVMQPHALQPNGPSTNAPSHMDFIRVGGVGLGAIGFGAPMHVDVDQLDDYHLLMFCLQGRARALADDQLLVIDHRHGMISGPGKHFMADLSGDCEQFVMRLDRAAVFAHTGHWNLRLQPSLDLGSAALQPWLAQLQLLVNSPSLLRLAQDNPLIAADFERLLISLLLAGQPWRPLDDTGVRERVVSPSCVRKAEAYMEANVARPICLADIAQASGVPVRTLLDAFQRFREHSPMQRLREMRLERAHAQLLAADGNTSVAGVALDCGFAHFGRFSEAYRRRFGISPSATLRRLIGPIQRTG